MSQRDSSKLYQVQYTTWCRSGCGVLVLSINSERSASDRNGKWIRCAECGEIMLAEKGTPDEIE